MRPGAVRGDGLRKRPGAAAVGASAAAAGALVNQRLW
jgi:hypothetical protein